MISLMRRQMAAAVTSIMRASLVPVQLPSPGALPEDTSMFGGNTRTGSCKEDEGVLSLLG